MLRRPPRSTRTDTLCPSPTRFRSPSQQVLEGLTAEIPAMIGGSADLTGSNNTKAKAQGPVKPDDFSGSYIHYGVREHGMAAAMNGIALHGGLIPYGGTFLVFTDYCRPSIRLSALMGLDRKSTRSELQSLMRISYAVFCLKKKKKHKQ